MKKILLSGSLAILFTGCAQNVLTHDEVKTIAQSSVELPNIPKTYSNTINSVAVEDNWIYTFHDPKLNALVKEAQKNNPSLKVAAAKVERATALTKLTESELKPSVGASAYYHDNNAEGSNEVSFGGLGISWEPDVWGRVGNAVAAQQELTNAKIADYNFARQSLSANTAKTWFLLNANSKIYEFSKEIVRLQKKGLKILTAREQIGQGNKRDVHISQALVAEAKEATRTALTAKERSQRALEVLIGRYPSGKLQAKSLYMLPSRIPNGLPSELLERRPDLIAAQERVASAFHQKASAKLLHLPHINLKLGVGPNSINDAISNLAAGLFAPLYTGGAIEAQVAIANAEQKAAIAAYAKTALNAFQEVENTLAAEKHLSARLNYVSTMVKEYKVAYDMTVERYRIGDSSVLDIIIVQGKWVTAEIKKMQVLRQRLINRVNLHLALGGSFKNHKH